MVVVHLDLQGRYVGWVLRGSSYCPSRALPSLRPGALGPAGKESRQAGGRSPRQPPRHDHLAGRRHARRTRTISRRDIELFTEISGDRNPIHYDDDLAAQLALRRVVVQGGVTSGLLNAVVAEELPGPGSVFLEVNWRFRAPVRPGRRDHRRGHRHQRPRGQAGHHARRAITNQDGVVVLDGTAVVWRDPVVGPPPTDRPGIRITIDRAGHHRHRPQEEPHDHHHREPAAQRRGHRDPVRHPRRRQGPERDREVPVPGDATPG